MARTKIIHVCLFAMSACGLSIALIPSAKAEAGSSEARDERLDVRSLKPGDQVRFAQNLTVLIDPCGDARTSWDSVRCALTDAGGPLLAKPRTVRMGAPATVVKTEFIVMGVSPSSGPSYLRQAVHLRLNRCDDDCLVFVYWDSHGLSISPFTAAISRDLDETLKGVFESSSGPFRCCLRNVQPGVNSGSEALCHQRYSDIAAPERSAVASMADAQRVCGRLGFTGVKSRDSGSVLPVSF